MTSATRPISFHRVMCSTPFVKAPPVHASFSASSLSETTCRVPFGSSCSSLSSLETLDTHAASRKRKADAAALDAVDGCSPSDADGHARRYTPSSTRQAARQAPTRKGQECEDNGHLLCSEGLEEAGPAVTPSAVPDEEERTTPASATSEGVPFSMTVTDNYDAGHTLPYTCSVDVTSSFSGAFVYRQVPATSYIGLLAATYGFTPLTTSVGSAYFERLTARDPYLKAAALAQPESAGFVDAKACDPEPLAKPLGAGVLAFSTSKRWVVAVHLACIYIAAKNVEYVPYKKLLQTMLSRLEGAPVSAQAAAALEMEVLQGLRWRLGPYFRSCAQ